MTDDIHRTAPQADPHGEDQKPRESIIPTQATFTGDLDTPGSVRISGRVEGNVRSGGTVWITGTVIGNVQGDTIICTGTVKGDLEAGQLVELKSGCFVRGDIKTPSVIRSEGASHNGKLIL